MALFLEYYNIIDIFLHGGLWFAHILYFACLVPQIFTNYKQKCGKGISSILLIGYLNAFIFLLFFIFLKNLPAAYKFILPLKTIAVLVLILQRLYYDDYQRVKKYWYALGINLIIFVFFIPLARNYPVIIGTLFGWINFLLSIFYQLPQIIKIHKKKSVKGFNVLFVAFTFTAALIETILSFLAHLPAPTRFGAVRAVIVCLIIFAQFYYFQKRSTNQLLD